MDKMDHSRCGHANTSAARKRCRRDHGVVVPKRNPQVRSKRPTEAAARKIFAESRYEVFKQDRERFAFLERPRPLEPNSGHDTCTHPNTGHARLDCLIARGLMPPRAEMESAVERARVARWQALGRPPEPS